MPFGQALIDEINATRVAKGELALWWLGQASYIFKAGAHVVYIDPYLSENPHRQHAPPLKPSEVSNATIFACTHDHIDHIDPGTLPDASAASPKAKIVVPEVHRKQLPRRLNIASDRFVGIDAEQTIEIDGVKITAIAAAHEFFYRDEKTGHFPYLGFFFEVNGITLFHSGDTVKYEGLETRLSKLPKIDVMLLPINGRDAKRYRTNIIGNMTFQEAVDLAGATKPGVVCPMHWDMFAGNPGDPAAFVDYAAAKWPELRTFVCERAVCHRFKAL